MTTGGVLTTSGGGYGGAMNLIVYLIALAVSGLVVPIAESPALCPIEFAHPRPAPPEFAHGQAWPVPSPKQ